MDQVNFTPSHREAVSHLKNLFAIAQADGIILEIEQHLLISIAHRLGISMDELDHIKEDMDQISFVLPEKYEQRIEQFQDILMLVSIDGNINQKELEKCRKIAEKFNLTEPDIQRATKSYLV